MILCLRSHTDTLSFQILDTNPALYFHLQQQKLIEYIRHGRIAEALQFAQEELAPRGEESPEFLSELERTMALLAFESSSSSPAGIADLLSPAQRMKTAGEVNAAILESLSQGKEVKLIGLLRLLCWGEAMLGESAEFPKVREWPILQENIRLTACAGESGRRNVTGDDKPLCN